MYATSGGKAFRELKGGTRNRFIADLNRLIRVRGGGDFEGFFQSTNVVAVTEYLLSSYSRDSYLNSRVNEKDRTDTYYKKYNKLVDNVCTAISNSADTENYL